MKNNNLFWAKILLICTLLTTIMLSRFMNQDKPCFTDQMPNHFFQNTEIIALEYADEISEFDQILSPGKIICEKHVDDRIAFFIRSIKWDFGYIVSYGLLFLVLLFCLSGGEIRLLQKILSYIIVLVCLLDVGENVFLIKALRHFEVPGSSTGQTIQIMYTFAVLKWTFLFFYCLGILYLATQKMNKTLRNAILLIYAIFILIYLIFPFSNLPLVGNGVQLVIFASLPVLLWGLIQGFRTQRFN